MARNKPGRNAPCPCGSGKKYKNCCLNRQDGFVRRMRANSKLVSPAQSRIQKDQIRKERFGEVRPVVHTKLKGYKVVAVGNELHFGKRWRTFPDFLQYYIKKVLGVEWGQAQLKKPLEERHEVMKWYDAMCRYQNKQKKTPNGLYGCIPNGAMRAYLLLSYDLYTLRHHSALQESIVDRLKHVDQFQGARHELFAAATCIRAGYGIAFEDERDRSRRHVEFDAVHKATGQVITVEAKSRHRRGILGRPGTKTVSNLVRVGIQRLLRDALGKPTSHPYVVFFDLNLPPSPKPLMETAWFREAAGSVVRAAERKNANKDCFNLIVLTNYPDHYGDCNKPYPRGDVVSMCGRNPIVPASHPGAILALHVAAMKYGTIPNFFEEGSG